MTRLFQALAAVCLAGVLQGCAIWGGIEDERLMDTMASDKAVSLITKNNLMAEKLGDGWNINVYTYYGHVFLVGDEDVDSLVGVFYEPERRAEDGGPGRGRFKHGANGRDVTVRVPLGTVVKDAGTGRELGEILEHGQAIRVAEGGRGGAGNVHFKS